MAGPGGAFRSFIPPEGRAIVAPRSQPIPGIAVADIFREVDEELRRDRAAQLWKKYGRYVIGGAVAVVLATLAYQLWQTWDRERRLERSERFTAALQLAVGHDGDAAVLALAELGGPDGGYGTLAAFERARILAEQGRREEALAIWDELSGDTASGRALQAAATLFYVMHQIDDGDPAALRAKLQPLVIAGNGFRPTARELMAVLALRQGDREQARQIYTELADDLDAPPGLRARAAQMVAALKGANQP